MSIKVYNPSGENLEKEFDGTLYIIKAGEVKDIFRDEAALHICEIEKLGQFGLVAWNPQERPLFASDEEYMASLRKKGLTARYAHNLELVKEHRAMESECLSKNRADHLSRATAVSIPMEEMQEYEKEFLPATQRAFMNKTRRDSEKAVEQSQQRIKGKIGRPKRVMVTA